MAVEIIVQIFPSPGGGVQVVQGPRGEAMPIVLPFLEYTRVREIVVQQQDYIKFVTRAGEEIETNMPYLIKRVNVSEGNA